MYYKLLLIFWNCNFYLAIPLIITIYLFPILYRVLKLEKFSFSLHEWIEEWIVFIYEEQTGFRYWHFYCQKYMAIEYWGNRNENKKKAIYFIVIYLSCCLGFYIEWVLFIESFLNGFDSTSNTPQKNWTPIDYNENQWIKNTLV